MDNNFGVKISIPGVDVRKATTSQLILNSNDPFLKLNTQTTKSYQTITLLFNNDPPEPSGGTDAITTVYQFAHDYNYAPRVWSLFQTLIVPIGATFNQTYFQDSGIISAKTADDQVTMYVTADTANVYVKVDKFNDGFGNTNNLIGSSFKFTIFTFVDDYSGN